MSSLSTDTSILPKRRPIPEFTINRETLEYLKKNNFLCYLVALACLKDGRWRLAHPEASDELVLSKEAKVPQGMN